MADNNLAPRSKNKLPWYERALSMEGRATFLPYQDTLPGSVMNQRSFALPGIIAGAANALTAPGRAYSGSDQSFDPAAEAANFAMTTMGGGMGASRLAPAPRNALGMNVYQGSPHRFPPTAKNPLGEFDASKIGSGEGAQVYGHGHYSAESPAVAQGYADILGFLGAHDALGNQIGTYELASFFENALKAKGVPAENAKQQAQMWTSKFVNGGQISHPAAREVIESKGLSPAKGGLLYTIDLPDEHIAKMLDYDKPLSQQSSMLQQNIYNSMIDAGFEKPLVNYILNNKTGSELLNELAGRLSIRNPSPMSANAQASDFLRNAGVPGIRYLDAGSRGAGEGTSNFVVFPGNEDMMRIINRE